MMGLFLYYIGTHLGTRIGPNHLFVRLLFSSFVPKKDRVRHQLLNKIKSFDSMMDSFEKHWRTCKRGALPN